MSDGRHAARHVFGSATTTQKDAVHQSPLLLLILVVRNQTPNARSTPRCARVKCGRRRQSQPPIVAKVETACRVWYMLSDVQNTPGKIPRVLWWLTRSCNGEKGCPTYVVDRPGLALQGGGGRRAQAQMKPTPRWKENSNDISYP